MGLRDVFKNLLILIILVVAVFQNKNQTLIIFQHLHIYISTFVIFQELLNICCDNATSIRKYSGEHFGEQGSTHLFEVLS